MESKQISLSDAQRVYNELALGQAIDWKSIETPVTSEDGQKLIVDPKTLEQSLLELKRSYPEELGARSADGTRFDAEASVVIHKALPLDDITAARQEFWAWLSLRFFWDLTNWRHGSRSKLAIPENFSITKRRHGLLERLWFRAELGRADGKNPYQFVLKARDRDFWESGIIRPSYSSCRPVALALVRYQFQNGNGYLHLTDPQGVRELYKRIRRIYSTVALDLLDGDQAFDLIAELGRGLKRSGRGTREAAG
jgi:hypothetical protein